MAITNSKLTAQGRISIPAEVRPAVPYTSEDVHKSLFEETPTTRTLGELKEGVRRHAKSRPTRR